jgi:tetratricopeptide (TPR) repeat protein
MRMFLTIFLCAALMSSPPCLSADSFKSLHQQTSKLMREHQYEQALEILARALALQPKNSIVYRDIGECNYRMQRYDDALKNLTRSIELSNKDWWAYNLRYHIYIDRREYKKALLDCEKCLNLQPNFFVPQKDIIALCKRLPGDKDAEAIMAKLSKTQPVVIVRDLMSHSKYKEALALLTEELKKPLPKEQRIILLDRREHCHTRLHDQTKALADLNEIVRLKPDSHYTVYLRKASLELKMNKYRESARDLTVVLDRKPKSRNSVTTDELYYRRATCYSKCGEYRKAILDYDTILKMDPSHEEAYKQRSYCYAALKGK